MIYPSPHRLHAVLAGVMLACVGALSAASADEDVAAAALAAGRQALAREDHAAAKAHFERALKEEPGLHEAALLLGRAHLGADAKKDALTTLRKLATRLEGDAPLSQGDRDVYGRLREVLKGASEADAALDALVRKHIGSGEVLLVNRDLKRQVAMKVLRKDSERQSTGLTSWPRPRSRATRAPGRATRA